MSLAKAVAFTDILCQNLRLIDVLGRYRLVGLVKRSRTGCTTNVCGLKTPQNVCVEEYHTNFISTMQIHLISVVAASCLTGGTAFHLPKSMQQLSAMSWLESRLQSATDEDNTRTVTPIKSLDGTVTLPGSKSLSNRCLLLAALSDGNTKVDNLLESDDIRYMLEALDQLEVPVERHSAESVTVTGQNGPINPPLNEDETSELFLGNAGTAMRPLAAALCMGQGNFVLDGVPRMRERPIADLIDGLQQLGADVTCVEETGCPPVTIHAKGLKGGKVRMLSS